MSWRDHLLEGFDAIAALIAATRSIAVIGIKPESRAAQPAFYVPRYLAEAEFQIIPVPVYEFGVTHILDRPIRRSLAQIDHAVDMVQLFRRAADVPKHLDEILASGPRAVWMQQGIRHEAVAEALARAGIDVVQDRCLMVDHRAMMRAP